MTTLQTCEAIKFYADIIVKLAQRDVYTNASERPTEMDDVRDLQLQIIAFHKGLAPTFFDFSSRSKTATFCYRQIHQLTASLRR